MELISYQEYDTANHRILELQNQIELEPIEESELDRLITATNKFKEKLLNFE